MPRWREKTTLYMGWGGIEYAYNESIGFMLLPVYLGECTLCYHEQSFLVQLPCSHEFGIDCITEWFMRNASCPMCRTRYHFLEYLH